MTSYEILGATQIEAMLCARLEAIRLNRNITQADLAQEAGVSPRTIRRMAKGQGVSLETFIRVMKALGLEQRFDTLLPPQQISPIDRVKESRPPRLRASGRRKQNPDDETPWTWGDE